MTFSAILNADGSRNSARQDILSMIGQGSATDGGPSDCSDLIRLYVEPWLPVGLGCLVSCDPGGIDCEEQDPPCTGLTARPWWLYYLSGIAGPPITIHDLDGLVPPRSCPAPVVLRLPGRRLLGHAQQRSQPGDGDNPCAEPVGHPRRRRRRLFPCENVETNDPTANVLGWLLTFTDLIGRQQSRIFWRNAGEWTTLLSDWRITREPPLMGRDGATLLKLRFGYRKYTYERGL